MAIRPRKRLGPYEFLSSIGAGGIGRIYRVRNTLNREVARNRCPKFSRLIVIARRILNAKLPRWQGCITHSSQRFTAWKAIWFPRRIWPPVISNINNGIAG
jgi:hypothetical protein